MLVFNFLFCLFITNRELVLHCEICFCYFYVFNLVFTYLYFIPHLINLLLMGLFINFYFKCLLFYLMLKFYLSIFIFCIFVISNNAISLFYTSSIIYDICYYCLDFLKLNFTHFLTILILIYDTKLRLD